jgi:hypothetical protein
MVGMSDPATHPDWNPRELQACIASHEREMRKAVSDAIRQAVRTTAGIPEGDYVPTAAFDAAASLALKYLIEARHLS